MRRGADRDRAGRVDQPADRARDGSGADDGFGRGARRRGGQCRLGYSNTSTIGDNETPATAGDVSVGGSVVQIAAGQSHTCALLDTGAVRCWGAGADGRLGYGNTSTIGDNETPASAGNVVVGGAVVQIGAGQSHTCALLDTGAVRCWGAGADGRLGYGNTSTIGYSETPASVGDIVVGGTVVRIAAGQSHTCALLDTGAVRCWGLGIEGRLGYSSNVPVGGTVVQIAVGKVHTCARLDTGNVRCWGSGFSGQLGYGNTNTLGDNETPASAGDVLVGGTVVQIELGDSRSCARLATGKIRCWGSGFNGKLGYGNTVTVGDDEAPNTAGDVSLF
jgi:alpha-tubulin suppressor-like RCC1 family protein